jgi:hypothetical protein
VRRPRRVFQAFAFVSRTQLEEAFQRTGLVVDAGMPVAEVFGMM